MRENLSEEGWEDLLEETLERTLLCLGEGGNEAGESALKHRMDVLELRHPYRESKERRYASRLLADGAENKSLPAVFEVSRKSLASRALKVSCSFGHDAARDSVARAIASR